MSEFQAIEIPSKAVDSIFRALLLCVIVCPLMAFIYASVIRGISVYFFIGAVIVIPWIAAFFGYCIGYVSCVLFQKNESFSQSIQIKYLIGFALVTFYCCHWLVWMLYVIDSQVSTNPETMLLQTYSYFGQFYTLATDPGLLVDILKEINAVGTWRIDDDEDLMLGKTKGITLVVFWLVELLLMAMFPFFVKLKASRDNGQIDNGHKDNGFKSSARKTK